MPTLDMTHRISATIKAERLNWTIQPTLTGQFLLYRRGLTSAKRHNAEATQLQVALQNEGIAATPERNALYRYDLTVEG